MEVFSELKIIDYPIQILCGVLCAGLEPRSHSPDLIRVGDAGHAALLGGILRHAQSKFTESLEIQISGLVRARLSSIWVLHRLALLRVFPCYRSNTPDGNHLW